MKRLLLALALIATPATAENVKLFVVQKDGGVVQRPGNVTVEGAAIVMGQKRPPEGTTGLVIEKGKPARWTDLTPEEVHKKFGGEGDPEVELFPKHEDKQKPIEIFPAEEDDSGEVIKLRAGNWIGNILSQNITDCPAGVATPLAAQFAGIDGGPIQGTIDASFTPARIAPQLEWTKTGPNSWVGDLVRSAGGDNGIRVQWAVRIKSSSLILNRQQISFSGPLVGACKVLTEVEYERKN